MHVVLTRPQRDGRRWLERLRARGHDGLLLPLIAIGPPAQPQALAAAWQRIGDYRAAMFVSGNAVEAFFAAAPAAVAFTPRAWAPGPGTSEALLAAWVAAQAIDAPAADAAQFDSDSLWQVVAGQLRAGERLLLVRGADAQGRAQGRDWLGQQLAAQGVVVDTVAAYVRQAPAWSPAERAAATGAAGDGSLWIFSSSEAAQNLQRLLPQQDWSRARALATHPRIAQALHAMGFGSVHETRPALADVVASIESIR
jgi:uroporphyrinogen-III synthase